MGIKKYKPTSPGCRLKSGFDFSELTTDRPYKPLLRKLRRSAGRNNLGRVTAYHRGRGHKRAYRIIDFKRKKFDIKGAKNTIINAINSPLIIETIHAVLIYFLMSLFS